MRLRVPEAEEIAAASHLAALAVLDAALAVAARAVRAAVPAVDRGPFPGDPAEIATARTLVDECDRHLRPGEAVEWTREYFENLGLYRLRGTIKFPEQPFWQKGAA